MVVDGGEVVKDRVRRLDESDRDLWSAFNSLRDEMRRDLGLIRETLAGLAGSYATAVGVARLAERVSALEVSRAQSDAALSAYRWVFTALLIPLGGLVVAVVGLWWRIAAGS